MKDTTNPITSSIDDFSVFKATERRPRGLCAGHVVTPVGHDQLAHLEARCVWNGEGVVTIGQGLHFDDVLDHEALPLLELFSAAGLDPVEGGDEGVGGDEGGGGVYGGQS